MLGIFYSQVSLKNCASERAHQNVCDDRYRKLQLQVSELLLKLESKDAKIAEIQQNIFLLFISELGIKLSLGQKQLLGLEETSGRGPPESKIIASGDKKEITTVQVAPAYEVTNSKGHSSSVGPIVLDKKSYLHFEEKILFGIPRLFEKSPTVVTDLNWFKEFTGKYIGLISFDGGGKATVDLEIVSKNELSLKIIHFDGQVLIDTKGPTKEFKVFTYGRDNISSVGEVNTILISIGEHDLSLAYPADETHERGQGKMMEGFYQLKKKKGPKGSLYIYKQGAFKDGDD